MFNKPVDIGNRALQHVGAPRIATFDDISKQAAEVGFCYDKLRRAELRRSVWRFATRRAVLRPITSSTLRFIPPTWVTAINYQIGSVVQDANGTYWMCMVPALSAATNAPGVPQVGQQPYWQQYFGPLHCDPYNAGVSYYAGEPVYNSGSFYISIVNGNQGQGVGSAPFFTQSGATFQAVNPLIPAGPNVTINGRNRNLYPLPYGYLRATYPDPKVESTSTNVTSAGLRYSDWQFEGNFIISNSTDPIILRFVGDVSDVTTMDDLFCEGLASRIGYEVCEIITQSNIKLQAIAQAYQKFIADARMVNLIETGSTEPEEETYNLTQGPAGVAESSVAIAQGQAGGGGAARGGQ